MDIGPIAGISSIRLDRLPQSNQNAHPFPRVDAAEQMNDRYQPREGSSQQQSRHAHESSIPLIEDSDQSPGWTASPYEPSARATGPKSPKISYFV